MPNPLDVPRVGDRVQEEQDRALVESQKRVEGWGRRTSMTPAEFHAYQRHTKRELLRNEGVGL